MICSGNVESHFYFNQDIVLKKNHLTILIDDYDKVKIKASDLNIDFKKINNFTNFIQYTTEYFNNNQILRKQFTRK